jgi:hypothetical protein
MSGVMRRFTNIKDDGWALISAETRHAESSASFEIPPRDVRYSLRKGDAAKLLFDMETREGGIVIDRGVDRMWVIVIGREESLYVGTLISDPGVAKGLNLRPGDELVFRPEHVCAVDRPPDAFLVAEFGADFLKNG